MLYFAIGNSLTLHGKCVYWWRECGMAATDEKHDYVHLVTDALEKKYDTAVNAKTYNFFAWEQAETRDALLSQLDEFLAQSPDVITVQLGENVGTDNRATLEADYVKLLQYIKEKCPAAKLIVLGDFWETDRDDMRRSAAQTCGVAFADILPRVTPDSRAGLYTKVFGDDGEWHVIEHEGVAAHPGDAGMAMIAQTIIEAMN